ncbi:MAG: single-stranded DNA-binding protein [Bacteroidetes bacterium]|nr:MAG: single-stranded DNA-binding protein [Bacteroidota bacterium]
MHALNNYVQLIGNLGRDVDFQALANGNARAKVSIATKEIYRNRAGEKQEEVQWHHLVGWGKIAEHMQTQLGKGKLIMVHGKLKTQIRGEGKHRRVFTEIVVQKFRVLRSPLTPAA